MNTREVTSNYRLSHWAQVVQNRIESSLSVSAYCEREGISRHRYYYWQNKLRETVCKDLAIIGDKAPSIDSSVFAEVKQSAHSHYHASGNASQNQLFVEAGALRITAGCDYPVDKLVVLLQGVNQSC
ncbi:MAG: hypothetical protein LBU89_06090 [Fibromonadaceae bacterium]|jgi:hypothetical protein|nr:hypothetical protein [Fibromonadaceae bacterium]